MKKEKKDKDKNSEDNKAIGMSTWSIFRCCHRYHNA